MMRDIDFVITDIQTAYPDVKVEQQKAVHLGDDAGLWSFTRPHFEFEVQLEARSGMGPFLINTNEHGGYIWIRTRSETITNTVAWLGLDLNPILDRLQPDHSQLPPFIPFVLREESYPAMLTHSGQPICRLLKAWEGERLLLSKRAATFGTWHFAEIDSSTNPFEKEKNIKFARLFWSKGKQHKVSYEDEWKNEEWRIIFNNTPLGADSMFPIYPPKFESPSLLRWFYPDRKL